MVSVGFVMLVRLVTVPALFVLACSSPIEPFSPGGGPGQRSSFRGAGESGTWPTAAAPIVSNSPRPSAWIFMVVETRVVMGNRSGPGPILGSLPAVLRPGLPARLTGLDRPRPTAAAKP